MKIGNSVFATKDIMSDDRELGIDDGSPIVPRGTYGIILGMSIDDLVGDEQIKDGCEHALMVEFHLKDSRYIFDVFPEDISYVANYN